MGDWLAQWLISNGFMGAPPKENFDTFEFIENHPAKDKIFEKLCIGGLCRSLDSTMNDILATLGYDYARRHLVIPIGREGENLHIATCDPCAFGTIDDIGARLGLNVICMLAKRSLLLSFFNEQRIGGAREESTAVRGERSENKKEERPKIPLDRLFEYFAELAVAARASDVHFECNGTGMRLRFRIDGKLKTIRQLDQNLARAAVTNIKLRAKLKLDETRLPQDGRLKIGIGGRTHDVRVSIIPNIYGENAVLRIFNGEREDFSLSNLGLNTSQISWINALSSLDSGLLLIAGPTGSGKTTTAYSLLKHIASPSKKVITVEDPIEYMLPRVSQVAVDEKIGLTFERILRAILRQAPNVIFIGEIRDPETAQSAIQAALTGHLILSTVHAGSAEEAVTRLQDLGISHYLIDSCLRCVIYQELMRLKCKFCQGEAQCSKCLGRKYYGRTGVFEILVSNDFIAGASPSKFNNFGFLCTVEREIARLGAILYGEDVRLKNLSL
ncbi:MAG: GspE/PulE family protein [Puniceicoccales bacterium]|jgi:type II secretory ATPase GspE/PulE/Tfp pilus assembly ATPase PilB-like protein|nr:GspE/PulE family protein [Puniceicoccales bacterium]